jgi:hypothetical protein
MEKYILEQLFLKNPQMLKIHFQPFLLQHRRHPPDHFQILRLPYFRYKNQRSKRRLRRLL